MVVHARCINTRDRLWNRRPISSPCKVTVQPEKVAPMRPLDTLAFAPSVYPPETGRGPRPVPAETSWSSHVGRTSKDARPLPRDGAPSHHSAYSRFRQPRRPMRPSIQTTQSDGEPANAGETAAAPLIWPEPSLCVSALASVRTRTSGLGQFRANATTPATLAIAPSITNEHPQRASAVVADRDPAREILSRCFVAFEAFAQSERDGRERVSGAQDHFLLLLANAVRLHLHERQNPGTLDSLYVQYHVPTIKEGRNPYVRLARLVLRPRVGDGNAGSSTIQRAAATLRYAVENEFSPKALPNEVKARGGVKGCAALDARAHESPERQRAKQRDKDRIADMRRHAPPLSTSLPLDQMRPGQFYALLVEVTDEGLRMMGLKQEDEHGTRRYNPLGRTG